MSGEAAEERRERKMKIHLPARTVPVLLIFCMIGLAFHFLPALGVPDPDVISYYRFWAAPSDNKQLINAIPLQWKQMGFIPSGLFPFFFNYWHPYTGRFDILTISYFWGMARLFGDNGDIWRLAATLFVSLAIGLFYLVAIRLRISRVLAWFLALSLFFTPIGWLRGIEAEIRAVFFLMLALHLTLSSGRRWNSILSALAMAAAVLTKETFFGAWIFIPVLIVYREQENSDAPRRSLYPKLLEQLTPHFAAGALVLMFFAYVKLSIPVLVDYVFQSSAALPPLFVYAVNTIWTLQPDLTFLNLLPWDKGMLILFVLAACLWLFRRADYARWFKDWDPRFVLVILGLVFAFAFYAAPFYVTSRSIEGRYAAPASFLVALFIGLIVTPFFHAVITVFRQRLLPHVEKIIAPRAVLNFVVNGLLLVLTVIAVATPLDALIVESVQYRTDMMAWQGLNDSVIREAPRGAHVVATFPSPSMGENDVLLINMLLSGRYDIIYHVGGFSESVCMKMPDLCRSYAEFDALQPPLPNDPSVPIMYVNVSSGSGSQRPALPTSLLKTLRLLVLSPVDYLRARYTEGFKPYIEYSISIHQ